MRRPKADDTCAVISLAHERAMRDAQRHREASAATLVPLIEDYRKAHEMLAAAEKSSAQVRLETELRASEDLVLLAQVAGVTPRQARDVLVGLYQLGRKRRAAVEESIAARVERLGGK
jgi:hypothetical protein